MTQAKGQAPPRATPARRVAVRRAEAHLRARGGPLRVPTLSRLVGLSERAFRNAVVGVHGISPVRWMRELRLTAARQALLDAGNDLPTVTVAATEQGFYQLGRFAGHYKAAFGEPPSQTLRRRARFNGADGGCA